MKNVIRTQKVIVAMSGGVDSSVAAALLKRAGFNIQGVFLNLYENPRFEKSQQKAEKIAKVLGIPFSVLDLRKQFKKRVIDYFLREYQRGRTPNPCVKCNQEIKFGIFFKGALESGADYIATGHYARIIESGSSRQIHYLLKTARDKQKDQSYFLYNLNQRKLKKILFPVGDYLKLEVRKLARDFGIVSLVRPESKDICFLEGRHQDFLKKYLKLKPGPILNQEGKEIGFHQGLPLYTIGQRKEIRVAGPFPYYVLELDVRRNALIVTDNEKDLYKKELVAEKVNWISGKVPDFPLKIRAKIRYRHKPAAATIYHLKSNIYNLIFQKPQRAITPGQSVVFYKGEELLGGGIIRS